MKDKVSFNQEREYLNKIVLKYAGKSQKRFLNLDHAVYQDGALSSSTKEMLGLVASLVLRCDDCVKYHLSKCKENDISDVELEEIISVGLIVGGSITIPHIRRAMEYWDHMKKEND